MEAAMRFLFRWAFRFFLLAAVLAVALVLLKDQLAKAVAELHLRQQTGLEVRISRAAVGLSSPTLTLENLRIYNSAEFGGAPLIELPELHLEWDARRLPFQKVHFRLIRLNLTELHVVESRAGETNLVNVYARWQKNGEGAPRGGEQRGWQFEGIDTMNLTLGKIRYTNMRRPEQSGEIEMGVRNEIVTGIHSGLQLYEKIGELLLRKGITVSGNFASPLDIIPPPP
jgi:hypothetical protein